MEKSLLKRVKRSFLGIAYATWALFFCDCATTAIALTVAFCIRFIFPGSFTLENYQPTLLAFLFFPALLALVKSYGRNFLHPAEELKRIFLATTIGFLLLSTIFMILKSTDTISRVFFCIAWLLTLLLIPLGRLVLRALCHQASWWQLPLIVISSKEAFSSIEANIALTHHTPLRPEVLIIPENVTDPRKIPMGNETTIFSEAKSYTIKNIPLPSQRESLDKIIQTNILPLAQSMPDAVLMIHLPSLPTNIEQRILQTTTQHFKHIILIPELPWFYCMTAEISHFHKTFGLALQRNLADQTRRRIKRAIDLLLTFLAMPLLLPVFTLLAVGIKLTDKGPVLFKQKRIGYSGQEFFVYKFRTMNINSPEILKELLAKDKQAAAEWAATQKLKKDPRITRFGHILRKTSLDELPQLINVIIGDMSIVGPRPIVSDEIIKYGEVYGLYIQVLPGITGLWQVSGRNDTTYKERVELDAFYINNWSVWLDIYLILKTIPEVLKRKGAY